MSGVSFGPRAHFGWLRVDLGNDFAIRKARKPQFGSVAQRFSHHGLRHQQRLEIGKEIQPAKFMQVTEWPGVEHGRDFNRGRAIPTPRPEGSVALAVRRNGRSEIGAVPRHFLGH